MQYRGVHRPLVQQSYDWSETPPSIAVLEAIAALENTHATKLHTDVGITLYDAVDIEALDELLTHGGDISVSFTVEEYQIHLEGDLLTITSSGDTWAD